MLNQSDGAKPVKSVNDGHIYRLLLTPVSTDRTLAAVRIAGDERDLNEPTNWSAKPINTNEQTVRLEVAASPDCKSVDVGLRTTADTAGIRVYNTKGDLVAIYNNFNYDAPGYDPDKELDDSYVPPRGDIDLSSKGEFDFVQGEGYVTLPLEGTTTEYKVVVSSVLGDSRSLTYDLILTRRATGLKINEIRVNGNLATQMVNSGNDVHLQLDTVADANGDLRLVLANNGNLSSLLANDSVLFPGNAQAGFLAGDILTDLQRNNIVVTMEDGNIYLSIKGDTNPAAAVWYCLTMR